MVRPILALLGIWWAIGPVVAADLPTSLDLESLRGLVVQHDGRWPPLDTVARDVVESVTGNATFQGHDPVLLLLGWTFSPEQWKQQPLVSIGSAELRSELRLPVDRTLFSYAELSTHAPYLAIVEHMRASAANRKLNPLEAKVAEIRGKLLTLQSAFSGRVLRPIPHDGDINGTWQPIRPLIPQHAGTDDEVTQAWSKLDQAFRQDNGQDFAQAAKELEASLAALPAAYRPDRARIETELHYNRLQPFRRAWMCLLVGVGMSGLALMLRRKWFDVLTALVILAGFGVLTYGLSLRWQIAGRIPAANMYESLLFLSWGASAFAIVAYFALRDRLVPLTASAMGALALILADGLPLDHFIRPITPVLLDTIWMSIHVPIIMISYAVLAVAVVIAHIQLGVMALLPRRAALAGTLDRMHYWYVFIGTLLLLAGIITGSMWAASSWGRYWGWDPKEVWSLAAFVAYMAILHVRINRERVPGWAYVVALLLTAGVFAIIVPLLGPLTFVKTAAFAGVALAVCVFLLAYGAFATALKSILAFWLIIMTYVGVNYVLGIGLHSYGFGTGAVVRYLYGLAAADLLLITLLSVIYVLRTAGSTPEETTPLTNAA